MKTIMIEVKQIIKAAMIFATLFTVLSAWAGNASAGVVAPATQPAVVQAPAVMPANAAGVQPVAVNPTASNVVVNPVVVTTPVVVTPVFSPFLFRPFFNPFFFNADPFFGFGFGAVVVVD
jgi:hypothetical protein